MSDRGRRTERDRRRRTASQNFLADPSLARAIVAAAAVRRGDLVLDLGAGTGALTAPLARRARMVIAVERDPVWSQRLRARFADAANVEVVEGDMLALRLPGQPFRVVANVPFGISTAMLAALLDDPLTPLARADVILAWEVARKRTRLRGNLRNLTWAPWYEFTLGRRLPAGSFRPVPAVDAGVLTVVRRAVPLLPAAERDPYAAYVRGSFRQQRGHGWDVHRWVGAYREGRYGARTRRDSRHSM